MHEVWSNSQHKTKDRWFTYIRNMLPPVPRNPHRPPTADDTVTIKEA